MTIGSGIGKMHRLMRKAQGAPSFYWKGELVPCVVNTFAKGTVLEEGGFQIRTDAKIFVKKEDFITIDSTLVSIDSTLYTMDNDTPTPVAGRVLTLVGKSVENGFLGRPLKVEQTVDPLPSDPEGIWILYLKDPSQ
jgi:hypothetical protein